MFSVENNLHEMTTLPWLAWIRGVYKKGHVYNNGQKMPALRLSGIEDLFE